MAALLFSVSLTSCAHDYREARQTLKAAPITSFANPINPEPLQYAPLIPRTKHELEKKADDEQQALKTLQALRFR
jgi:hypothetical protein